jgi:hypothetical protein
MTRSPLANIVSAFTVWTPILTAVVAVVWVLCIGVMHLEIVTYGSEVFVKNSETANVPSWRMNQGGADGGMSSEQLMDVINSGDTQQMQSALNEIQAGGTGGAAQR